MIMTIASGKGGTGKTTVATNFARSLEAPVLLLDCDVEEPNAHLFIKPTLTASQPVYKQIPEIDTDRCTGCGRCAELCAYNALAVVKKKVLVFPDLCHGCGGCMLLCPEGAIREIGKEIGVVEQGQAEHIDFVHGALHVGEVMAGPVITAVKKQREYHALVIVDAPPGTSCPVVGTLLDSDFCILVTEPTPFGLHDLRLAVDVVRKLHLPCGVIINRADLGDRNVETYCQDEGIPVLMRIPADRRIAEAYSRGDMMVDAFPEYRQQFQQLLPTITQLVTQL
ncbi:(4Fe-4S)-binding protein [candidate division KSB3 bacterium]|uniref:(4Fe-4S)-binding protein n=1 Tax=candidate division KSB3 bacterium TaxID=2044937 RepID=A0A2G6K921_9BACT|nr:MAG: (4Fe-4S)-binding protein [candidate division KSB3 bacterium]